MQLTARRSLRALVLLALMPAVAGCSFIVDFAVVNLSRSPLTVTYRLRRDLMSMDASWRDPQLGDGGLFLRGRPVKWSNPAPTSVGRDTAGLRISVVVPPGYALWLGDETNYTGPDGLSGTTFPLAFVELSGEHGRMAFEGAQTAWAFESLDRHRYALTYH